MPTGLVDVVRMAKRSIILVEQLKESDWELQKTHCELKVTSGAGLKAQRLPLSKLEKAHFCCQQFGGVEEQIDLAREKVTSAEAAGAKAAVRSKK